MTDIIERIKRLFRRYDYGTLNSPDNDTLARCHRWTGVIEFRLWEKGHWRSPDYDYWCEAGPGHTFIPCQERKP